MQREMVARKPTNSSKHARETMGLVPFFVPFILVTPLNLTVPDSVCVLRLALDGLCLPWYFSTKIKQTPQTGKGKLHAMPP
jgi:hypothetical protein